MSSSWRQCEATMEELIQGQKERLLRLGRTLVPTLTSEDMLQPNDYPILDNDPTFRYEEGILAGMQATQMALRASCKDSKNSSFKPLY